ncbi:hypothetical protein ACLOJK_013794 [Asimina triloba]
MNGFVTSSTEKSVKNTGGPNGRPNHVYKACLRRKKLRELKNSPSFRQREGDNGVFQGTAACEIAVDFGSYDHPVVLTVEAQANHVGHLGAGLSKNLLLKDKKNRFYVVSALANTKVDLKVLSQRLGLGKGGLRMAPEEALQELLRFCTPVPLGCVTPFALINESARTVSLLLDQGFKAQEAPECLCLLGKGTIEMSETIKAHDLDKFLISIGRQPSYVDLEANPVVGKDQPPDLSLLVPSESPLLLNTSERPIPVQLPTQAENSVPVKNKSTDVPGKTVVPQKQAQQAVEKPRCGRDPLPAVTDVRNFVDEIINKTSKVVLSEIQKHGEQLGPVVLDGVRKQLTSDLENMTMMLKNAAYTQGFRAGIGSVALRNKRICSAGVRTQKHIDIVAKERFETLSQKTTTARAGA